MKERLTEAYSERLREFIELENEIRGVELNGPFLTSPGKLYRESIPKLMIVGQETKGWSKINIGIDGLMRAYEDFNLAENYYSSPFWNIIRKVERALENDKYSCAWTNLNKYDVDARRPIGVNEQSISKFDNLLLDEIEILAPDVCIFFTGPSFDHRLRELFDGLAFKEEDTWGIKQLATLTHQKLPTLTLRTYHPKYLRMRKYEERFIDFVRQKAHGA